MRDFLDNLIDRHVDAAPQIMPRLPSIFEPEVSHGGLDVAVPDSNAPEMEETDILPSRQVTIPTAFPTVVESVQPKAARAPTVPAREEKPSRKATPNESVFPLSPRERAGVREVNSTSDPLTLTLSQRERGFNQGFLKPSATLIAPLMGRVRHAHQQKPTEYTSPNPQATAEEQTSVTEPVNRPVFSLSHRKIPTVPPPSQGGGEEGVRQLNSTCDPLTLSRREGGLTQGLLTPSATSIAPAIPYPAGPERPVSQPEPVINVTIGRIEVRATPASTPQSQKTRSTPPVMTLDEYLQQRGKGDR